MANQYKYFWIQFLLSCLPDDLLDDYENPYQQKKFNFQSFRNGKSLWVRQQIHQQYSGEFILAVNGDDWKYLQHAIHQELTEKEFDYLVEGRDYIKIGDYRVYRHPMAIGQTFYIDDHAWRLEEKEPYLYYIYSKR